MKTRSEMIAEKKLSLWERGANAEQLQVIHHEFGPCSVLAAAGSGKTFALTRLVVRLVSLGITPGDRILAVTFSKKAGDEINKRVIDLGVKDARIGTWHSLCLQILKEDRTEWGSWTIDGANDKPQKAKYILKDVLGYKGMDWKGADLTKVSSFIGRCKANLFDPDSEGAMVLAKASFAWAATQAVKAFQLYNEALEEKQLLTYDDFLVFACKHLQSDENIRRAWAGKWDQLLCDEAQDNNQAQWTLCKLLAWDHQNFMAVGDCFQCHPPGVMIETARGEEVAIETLHSGDKIRSWNRNAQKMVGGRSIEIASRPYVGSLYTMKAAGRDVPMTPNHRVLARWTDHGVEVCVTYIMWRSDLGFRVGWCKLFSTTGKGGAARVNHFAHRCRIEKAEKAWILEVHDTRTEASIRESVIATNFGIPTATFEPVHGAQHLTRESIDTIFSAVREFGLEERGREVLREYERNFDFPMYPWPGQDRTSVERIGRMTYFEVFASNLLPELMSVPLPDANNAWTPIESVDISLYEGPVYSLDVAEDHTYAVNGVVVLNSIYGFRGSSPNYLANFEQHWPGAERIWLPRNYRSGRKIIEAANCIVRPAIIPGLEPKDMIGERDMDGVVRVLCAEAHDDEANEVVSAITASVEAAYCIECTNALSFINAKNQIEHDAGEEILQEGVHDTSDSLYAGMQQIDDRSSTRSGRTPAEDEASGSAKSSMEGGSIRSIERVRDDSDLPASVPSRASRSDGENVGSEITTRRSGSPQKRKNSRQSTEQSSVVQNQHGTHACTRCGKETKEACVVGSRLSDHTVLYRCNAQSRAIEEALLKHRIPYIVVGGVSFYERREVRDLLAYLRLATGCGKTDDIKRSINTPFRFLGAKFVDRVMTATGGSEDSHTNWVRIVDDVARQQGLQSRQRSSATEWSAMLTGLQSAIVAGAEPTATSEDKEGAKPNVLLENIIRSTRYIEWLQKEEGEESADNSAGSNVREMVRVAERFATAEDLLTYIDDTIKASRIQREDKQAGGERVLLMSVHRSKGLEWSHVYVIGMNEMVLPHAKGDPEEERRVAYVAATRARDVLTLSYVRRITTRAGVRDVQPSRFVIDTGLPLDLPMLERHAVAEPEGFIRDIAAEAEVNDLESQHS